MAKSMIPLDSLKNVNEYLDTRHHINKNVTSNINEFGRVVFAAGYDFSTREILCNLLAGRGLLLPNLQICLSINLKAMLGISGIQQQLYKALSKLDTAVDKFLEHTGINNILGRLDSALAEVTQIASMINFCGKPLTPIAITNTLENAMQSFLGKGKALIDKIGTIFPDQVGGCLAFDGKDFNLSLFSGGILGDLAGIWDRASTGALTQPELDLLESRIDEVITEVDTLIEDENNTTSVVEYGGSDFNDGYDVPLNTGLGVVHNPESVGIQGNASIASQLQSLYDRFAGYPVIDDNGKVYDNVFELILDENMIKLLQNPVNPTPTIATQDPIYNYCGDVVGYNTIITKQGGTVSDGIEPEPIPAPGFKSNGIDTSALANFNNNSAVVVPIPNSTVSVEYYSDSLMTTTSVPTIVSFNEPLSFGKNESVLYNITAFGRNTATGATTVIKKTGVLYTFNGTVTIPNDTISTEYYGDNTTPLLQVYPQVSDPQVNLYVVGKDNTTINWKVKFQVEKF